MPENDPRPTWCTHNFSVGPRCDCMLPGPPEDDGSGYCKRCFHLITLHAPQDDIPGEP